MKMNHYLWSIYLQAGGQKVVDCFSAFENGNREGFLSFILPLIGVYCPDATLINDFENDIGDALLTLEEQDQENFAANESISATENAAVKSRLYMNMAETEWQLLQKNSSHTILILK